MATATDTDKIVGALAAARILADAIRRSEPVVAMGMPDNLAQVRELLTCSAKVIDSLANMAQVMGEAAGWLEP